MSPSEGLVLGIWRSLCMLYIRIPPKTQYSHPQSALLKAGLTFPCYTDEKSNYQIPKRLGWSCTRNFCQNRIRISV